MPVTPLDIIKAAAQRLQYDKEHEPNGLWKTDPQKYIKEVITNPYTYDTFFEQYHTYDAVFKNEMTPDERDVLLAKYSSGNINSWMDKDQKQFFETLISMPAGDVMKIMSEESLLSSANKLSEEISGLKSNLSQQITDHINNNRPYKSERWDVPIRYSFVDPNRSIGAENQLYKFADRYIVIDDGYINMVSVIDKAHENEATRFYFPENFQERFDKVRQLGKGFEENSKEALKDINKYYKKHHKEIDGKIELKEIAVHDLINNPEKIWEENFKKVFKDFEPSKINDQENFKKRSYFYPHELLEFMYKLDKTINKVVKSIPEKDGDGIHDIQTIFDKIKPGGDSKEFNDNFDKLNKKSQELYIKGYEYLESIKPDIHNYEEFRREFQKLFQAILYKVKEEGIDIDGGGEKRKVKFQHIFEQQLPESYDLRNGEEMRSYCPCIYKIEEIEKFLKDHPKMFEGVMAPEQLEELNRLASEFSNTIKAINSEKSNGEVNMQKALKKGMELT